MMDTERQITRISRLLVKFLDDALSAEELGELEAWRDSSEANGQLFRKLASGEWDAADYRRYRAALEADGWEEIRRRMRRRHLRLWKRVAAYAAAVCVAGVVGYGTWSAFEGQTRQELPVVRNEIVPGTSKAVLKLAGGQQVLLGQEAGVDTVLLAQYGIKEEGKALSYGEAKAVDEYHTLEVPRGGEFALTLEDSTQVWVNAGSVLRFPVRFGGDKREVYLEEGEAYFEVTRDEQRPFRVHAAGMTVHVLGTGFNISAYRQEGKKAVTLAHGAVEVGEGAGSVVLRPNEQAVLADGAFEVRKVDAGKICAWRTGTLYFDAMPLGELAERLGRWFNCEVFFTTESLKQLTFTGAFRKYEDIGYIASILEAAADISIAVNGKTIIIGNK